MDIIIYLLLAAAGLMFIVFVIGIILPKERVKTYTKSFKASPKEVYSLVINNRDWQYRKNLFHLKIVSQNDTMEIWDEYYKSGRILRNNSRIKNPYSFYSFDMECSKFTGYFTAEFKEIDNEVTLFSATIHIQYKNPFDKILSYVFFNPGKPMEDYLKYTEEKLESFYSLHEIVNYTTPTPYFESNKAVHSE